MISVNEALQIVLENTPVLDEHVIGLMDSLGAVLSEDVISDINMPSFDKSTMDGYAVIASDTVDATTDRGIILKVIEEIPAGKVPQKVVKPGEASKIMTGAPLPPGSDAVVIVEATEVIGYGSEVKVFESVKPGENVRPMGEDISVGQTVLQKGKLIRPQEIGILATVGRTKVSVIRSPTVSVIATGNELVEPHCKPAAGQIRNSNGYSISAQVASTGAKAKYLGIAGDTESSLRRMILEGMEYELLLILGGVSVGEYDLVKDVLESYGIKLLFDKVRMKPGKPTVFGVKGSKVIFGLPGNPVSSLVAFEIFVRPAIRKMQGRSDLLPLKIVAILKEEFRTKEERRQFVPAWISQQGKNFYVEPVMSHGSGDLFSTTKANCLMIVPEGCQFLGEGSEVEVQIIRGWDV